MITLNSIRQLTGAIGRASEVTLSAYALAEGAVLTALVQAAQRGAHVTVRLEGSIYKDDGGVGASNRASISALLRAGADASLVHEHGEGNMLHLKAALVDGVAFLDDRNWRNDNDTIVRDDSPRDRAMLRDAARGIEDGPSRTFAVRKEDALALEARLIASARKGDRVLVESEAFRRGNPVYTAVAAAARRGARVRLLVSRRVERGNHREQLALDALRRDGVRIRSSERNEKFAVVDGARAWLGSANATSTYCDADEFDWGLRTSAPAVLKRLRAAFADGWRANATL